MKNYQLGEINYEDILSINKNEDGTIDVEFADGTMFEGVAGTPEEIRKIEERQDVQLKAGLNNFPKFKMKLSRAKLAGWITAFTGPTVFASGTVMTEDIPWINLLTIPISAAITFGFVASIATIRRYSGVVNELEKLKYRNDHRSMLDMISTYPNALANLSKRQTSRIKKAISKNEDPFSNICVDDFKKSDLETIVDNVSRENAYKFLYPQSEETPSKGFQFVKKNNTLSPNTPNK